MYPTGKVYLRAHEVIRVLRPRITSTSTLTTWRARGHIGSHGRNRYDMGEILNHLAVATAGSATPRTPRSRR